MQRPSEDAVGSSAQTDGEDPLVDVICMRHDGIKLTAAELREERPRRGHLHVDRGEARLTDVPTPSPAVGDVIPPLGHAHVYRVSGQAWVLHGYEHRDGQPAHKQAWYCTRVH